MHGLQNIIESAGRIFIAPHGFDRAQDVDYHIADTGVDGEDGDRAYCCSDSTFRVYAGGWHPSGSAARTFWANRADGFVYNCVSANRSYICNEVNYAGVVMRSCGNNGEPTATYIYSDGDNLAIGINVNSNYGPHDLGAYGAIDTPGQASMMLTLLPTAAGLDADSPCGILEIEFCPDGAASWDSGRQRVFAIDGDGRIYSSRQSPYSTNPTDIANALATIGLMAQPSNP